MARKRRSSWVTQYAKQAFIRAARTSPVDTKELPLPVNIPFSPQSDADAAELPSGNPEQAHGLTRTAQEGHKVVCKALIPHPTDPSLFLFGLRRDDEAWCNPGGHAEAGEDPLEAMHREFEEECGVPVDFFEHVYTQEVPAKNLTVHIFRGPPAEPDFWLSLDNSDDPDSEFVCYQFFNPLNTDLPLHVPVNRSAVAAYLKSGKTAYMNTVRDLVTEKEEFAGPGSEFMRTDEKIKDSYSNENQFEDADLKLGQALEPYSSGGMSPADPLVEHDEEKPMVQHAALPMGFGEKTRVEQTWVCPHCNEEIGEKGAYFDGTYWYHRSGHHDKPIAMPHQAVSTENSKGLGVQEENEREDFMLMKDLSIRTPL